MKYVEYFKSGYSTFSSNSFSTIYFSQKVPGYDLENLPPDFLQRLFHQCFHLLKCLLAEKDHSLSDLQAAQCVEAVHVILTARQYELTAIFHLEILQNADIPQQSLVTE